MGRKRIKSEVGRARPALARAGLLFPASRLQLDRARDLEREDKLVRVAWLQGDYTLWPTTALADDVLSLEELFHLASMVDFAVRRATDGARPSRATIIDAFALCDRVDRALDAMVMELGRLRASDINRAILSLTYLQFHTSRAMILYLQQHGAPDLAHPHDPDGWLGFRETSEIKRRFLERLIAAHTLVEQRTIALSLEHGLLYAQRIIAHVMVETSAVDADAVRTLRPSDAKLAAAIELVRQVHKAVRTDPDGERRVPCLLAEAVVTHLWTGDSAGFARALEAIAEDKTLPVTDRVNLMMSSWSIFSDSAEQQIRRLRKTIALVDSQPPQESQRLRAHVSPLLLGALAGLAASQPESASSLAGALAGFGTERVRWNALHPHVWLIGGATPVAVIDSRNRIEVIELPRLGDDGAIERLVNLHAEEFDVIHSLDNLRKILSEQTRPMSRRLAELDGHVSFHAFGHLRHIPVGALTGSGAVLASRPGVHYLARRRFNPQKRNRDGRLFLLDDSIAEVQRIRATDAEVARFDSSSAPEKSDPSAMSAALARMLEGAAEIIFFGHGYVDQFRHERCGLVSRQTDTGAYFVPAAEVAAQDLSGVELVVLMACGGGQGNVFTAAGLSIADAFCVAGASMVIAPLWPIVADEALDFLTRFLRRLDNGSGPTRAWADVVAEDPNRFCSISLFGD